MLNRPVDEDATRVAMTRDTAIASGRASERPARTVRSAKIPIKNVLGGSTGVRANGAGSEDALSRRGEPTSKRAVQTPTSPLCHTFPPEHLSTLHSVPFFN